MPGLFRSVIARVLVSMFALALLGVLAWRPARDRMSASASAAVSQFGQLLGADDEEVPVLVRMSVATAPLTQQEYERRKRRSGASIAGSDFIPSGPAIPLFEASQTDANAPITLSLRDVLVRTTMKRSQFRQLREQDAWRDRIFENVRITMPEPSSLYDTPIGTAGEVATKLLVSDLRRQGMTGASVAIGVVDRGFNVEVLKERIVQSDVPDCAPTPPCFAFSEAMSSDGAAPKGSAGNAEFGLTHGGMVAFAALLAAPQATLFDIVLSKSGEARIAEVIDAYGALVSRWDTLKKTAPESAPTSVVLVNSWGIWNPRDQDPDSSYVGNPSHPFVDTLKHLATLGIDVVFAAGDCGPKGSRQQCGAVGKGTIYGGNSYESVVSVGAVDIAGDYLEYSSQGPGAVFQNKPDVSSYAHYDGFLAIDSGTSASAPLVAGLIAAYRTKHPFVPGKPETSAAATRLRIIRAVEPCRYSEADPPPYDPRIGSGVVSARCLLLADIGS